VNTGILDADHWQLFGLEAAWVAGPLSLQAEQVFANVAQPTDDLGFQAWYVTSSYFLTGEHRRYRRELGVFDRVRPTTEFLATGEGVPHGLGAWEVAFRVSHIDLNDGSVQGGRLTDLTCGVNWYLNPYFRVQANYIRALLNEPTGRSSTDIFGARVGFDF
jgi:phosphate-selective porin OprO/OprP